MKNHEKWLLKATNDLASAKLLYEADYLDVAIYLTQQGAEKALKEYLAFNNQPIVKTHDLEELVDLCKPFDPAFSNLYSLAEKLSPFVVLYRYPEAELYPKKDTVLVAILEAEKILAFIKSKIPS